MEYRIGITTTTRHHLPWILFADVDRIVQYPRATHVYHSWLQYIRTFTGRAGIRRRKRCLYTKLYMHILTTCLGVSPSFTYISNTPKTIFPIIKRNMTIHVNRSARSGQQPTLRRPRYPRPLARLEVFSQHWQWRSATRLSNPRGTMDG